MIDISSGLSGNLLGYLRLWQQLPLQSWQRALLVFAVATALIPLLHPLARRLGFVDHPGGRKQHGAATPVHGGLVILIAMVVGSAAFGTFRAPVMHAFYVAGGLMVLVGVLDDLLDVQWSIKLAAQILAALWISVMGGASVQQLSDIIGIHGLALGWLGIPFAVFVVVGVINALNMTDGLDGLAGGQALVSLLLFVCFALYAGDSLMAERLLSVAAAVAGFLLWNLRFPWQPKAVVFLGDAGSMLLGFVIAWAAIRLSQNPEHPVSPVLGPWTIALPLIDCVSLIFHRLREGRSPFSADRDHLHHVLLDAGYRPMAISIGLMAVSAALGLTAALLLKMGVFRPLLVLAFLALLTGYAWLMHDRARAIAFFRALPLARLRGMPLA